MCLHRHKICKVRGYVVFSTRVFLICLEKKFNFSLKTSRKHPFYHPHISYLSYRLRREKPYASVAVPPAPVGVSSQRPLAPSVTSVTSVANVKGDNKMILGAVNTSPGICLTAEENPRNLS